MLSTFKLQNPWRQPNYKFATESYIHRKIISDLVVHLDKKEITVIVGSRQVGKTFAIKRLIEHLITEKTIAPRQIFYFNFDAFDLIEFIQKQTSFLDFLHTYGKPSSKFYVFFDEAQRIPDCGLLLKQYYHLDLPMKIIVSGSSSLEIKGQVKETLTGRKRLFEMLPVSFTEFLEYRGVNTGVALLKKVEFEMEIYHQMLEEFILFGGYPGVVMLKTKEEKIAALAEIYRSYIQKDISDFLKVQDVLGFNRLVQFVAAQNAGLFNLNEISKSISLSRYQLSQYVKFLEETYILKLLKPFYINLGKTIIKMPKVYFIDTGIRNVVVKQFGSLKTRADLGQIVENFVFSELIKFLDMDRLWFYRTTTGAEVDFCFGIGEGLSLIEVKYSAGKQRGIPKIFKSLIEKLNVNKCFVLTKSYIDKKSTADVPVYFSPVWSLPDLIGKDFGVEK